MIAIATLIVAFPAGFFLRDRLSAFVAYIAVFAFCYPYQGMYLLPMFTADAGPDDWPRNLDKFPVSYGVVTVLIYGVGFGLVALGHLVRTRRRARGAQQPYTELQQQPQAVAR